MRLIGDIHGNIEIYKELIRGCRESVQLGDFGVGFIQTDDLLKLDEEFPYHKFITGNHDCDEFARELKRYIPSGKYRDNSFVIRGAWSIDRDYRTPGFDWWKSEEHTEKEFDSLIEEYKDCKPDTVLSHDCPTEASYHMFFRNPKFVGYANGWQKITRTGEALQKMFEYHQPKNWYFGHWHFSTDLAIDGTNFKCLGINEAMDVEIN